MSAGGITYDGIYPKRISTLPSVETWGSNMNILKDPPKSIHTRKIDKVGDIQEIMNEQEDAGDRISEMIKVYPRGQNPFVDVQYSNNGTSGGQNRQIGTSGTVSSGGSGFTGNTSTGVGASGIGGVKLPHGVMTDGEFRPPVRSQFDELPLSRLPRAWTYATTNKGGQKKYMNTSNCSDEKSYDRAVKKCSTKNDERGGPQYAFKVAEPQRENYAVQQSIQQPIHTDFTAPKTGTLVDNRSMEAPSNIVRENYEHVSATAPIGSDVLFRRVTNQNQNVTEFLNNESLSGNYSTNTSGMRTDIIQDSDLNHNSHNIQHHLQGEVTTNHAAKFGGEQFMDFEEINLERNQPIAQGSTNISGNYMLNNGEYENNIQLKKNLPNYSSQIQMNQVDQADQQMGREFNRLNNKVNINEHYNGETVNHMPRLNGDNHYTLAESNQSRLNRNAAEYFVQRY